MSLEGKTLGILGAGNMAEALLRGVLRAKLLPPGAVVACDPQEARRAVFAGMGVRTTEEGREAAVCDLVLLSTKPQVFDGAVAAVADAMGPTTLAISIAAGIRTDRIARLLPGGARIVRVMPNTPMLVGCGVAGVARGPRATDADVRAVEALFACAGCAREFPEEQLDAVTALSGSGPAYLFRFVELLAEAGVAAGLPEEVAAAFAKGTVIGASCLLAESDESPEALRKKVTSPGGTTEAALRSFDKNGWGRIVTEAVRAARDRSVELAEGTR